MSNLYINKKNNLPILFQKIKYEFVKSKPIKLIN